MSSDYLKVEFLEGLPEERDDSKYRITPFAAKNNQIFLAPIKSAQKLTEHRDVNTVYKLGFDLRNIRHQAEPGDTVGILPSNNKIIVEKLFTRLNLTTVADKPCQVKILEGATKKKAIPKHLPPESTLRNIFLNHVDIHTPPKKLFLKSLARFVQDAAERTHLEQICLPQPSQEYTQLISTSGRTLMGLLDTFPSCQPPVAILLEHLPPLQPRPYSICASPLSNTLEITFFVLKHCDGRTGTCTGFLEDSISAKNPVPFYFRQPTAFRLPEDSSIPLILIATGTGIAPFRAFLQHRMLQECDNGTVWLFYGCRNRRDFLFQDEIQELVFSGIVNRLDVAFSREEAQKRYVQHQIEKNGDVFVEWVLQKQARIFVCGDVKTVVRDVRRCVVGVFGKLGGLSDVESENFMKEMESGGRFVVDTWI